MNNIDYLKQYNSKAGELKRLKARLDYINIMLDDEPDEVKAASINATAYKWDKDGSVENATIMPAGSKEKTDSSIVEKSVLKKEELERERAAIELKRAELNCRLIYIDTLLECLEYAHRYLLVKIYKEGLKGKRHSEKLQELFVKDIKPISSKHMYQLTKDAEREFNKLT